MKQLVAVFCLMSFSLSAFAEKPADSAEICASVKNNNEALGLVVDNYWRMSFYHAEPLVNNLDKLDLNKPSDAEFIGFHLGAISNSLASLGDLSQRLDLRSRGMRVLPEEQEKFNAAIGYDRTSKWHSAISCFRGYGINCSFNKGDKAAFKSVLKDLIEASKDISESKSFKECFLK